jgi:hypothetical protein
MALFSILFSILTVLTPIESLEKKSKKGIKRLLVPIKVQSGGYYQGVKVYNSPGGNMLFEVPKGLLVSVIKKKKKWSHIVITTPWYSEGWVKNSALGLVITENTYFYGSPKKNSLPAGWLKQGVIVEIVKKRGEFVEIVFHHHIPLRVFVKADKVGTKFGAHKNVRFKYYSKWKRNLYEVSKGPIYRDNGKSGKIAFLTKPSKLKIEKRAKGNKWAYVSSPSEYDMKFKGWVPNKRVGKKPHYYYSYRYSFRLNAVFTKSWLKGKYRLSVNKGVFLNATSTVPKVFLKKGSPISFFKNLGNGLFKVVFSRKEYGAAASLTSLLDYFENKSNYNSYYSSNYDKVYELKSFLYMGFDDIEPNR